MADSNSEQPLCPCGFWGTPQNKGLCSKCYREVQKQTGSSGTTASCGSTSTTLTEAFKPPVQETSTPVSHSQTNKEATPSRNAKPTEPSSTATPTTATITPPSSNGDVSQSSSELLTASDTSTEVSTGRKRENSEGQDDDRPKQQNKRRCFVCHCKLQPAIREIGKCRCELIFCQLHRLPEQHDCCYDYKEKGREQDRTKMVSPKKHMGNALKRIDSDP